MTTNSKTVFEYPRICINNTVATTEAAINEIKMALGPKPRKARFVQRVMDTEILNLRRIQRAFPGYIVEVLHSGCFELVPVF